MGGAGYTWSGEGGGGGGGGGRFGGGGGGSGTQGGGGGGGSSFVPVGGLTFPGLGLAAGGSTDPNYLSPAGRGGAACANGSNGRVVLLWQL